MAMQRDSRGRFTAGNKSGDGISVEVTIEMNFNDIEVAEEQARFRNFGHAASVIRKDAQSTIKTGGQMGRDKTTGRFTKRGRGTGSTPGTPPETRRGQIRRAIVYAADKYGAVIGPTSNLMDQSASAHEFGGTYKGQQFPKRPFMGPALERQTDRFAGSWRGSIGS